MINKMGDINVAVIKNAIGMLYNKTIYTQNLMNECYKNYMYNANSNDYTFIRDIMTIPYGTNNFPLNSPIVCCNIDSKLNTVGGDGKVTDTNIVTFGENSVISITPTSTGGTVFVPTKYIKENSEIIKNVTSLSDLQLLSGNTYYIKGWSLNGSVTCGFNSYNSSNIININNFNGEELNISNILDFNVFNSSCVVNSLNFNSANNTVKNQCVATNKSCVNISNNNMYNDYLHISNNTSGTLNIDNALTIYTDFKNVNLSNLPQDNCSVILKNANTIVSNSTSGDFKPVSIIYYGNQDILDILKVPKTNGEYAFGTLTTFGTANCPLETVYKMRALNTLIYGGKEVLDLSKTTQTINVLALLSDYNYNNITNYKVVSDLYVNGNINSYSSSSSDIKNVVGTNTLVLNGSINDLTLNDNMSNMSTLVIGGNVNNLTMDVLRLNNSNTFEIFTDKTEDGKVVNMCDLSCFGENTNICVNSKNINLHIYDTALNSLGILHGGNITKPVNATVSFKQYLYLNCDTINNNAITYNINANAYAAIRIVSENAKITDIFGGQNTSLNTSNIIYVFLPLNLYKSYKSTSVAAAGVLQFDDYLNCIMLIPTSKIANSATTILNAQTVLDDMRLNFSRCYVTI